MREFSALIHAFREDAQFPSSNEWGLPDLREDRLCAVVPESTWVSGPVVGTQLGLWGGHGGHALPAGLLIAFYVDDSRFESVWHNAVKMLEKIASLQPIGLVMPDFSMWQGDPLAVQLWAAYRSRWCARYWQEAGYDVVPSINFSDAQTHPWIAAGIPPGAPVMSMQCRTTRAPDKRGRARFLAGLRLTLDTLVPQKLVLYGGVDHQQWITAGLDFGGDHDPGIEWGETEPVWLDSWTHARARPRPRGSVNIEGEKT